MKAFIWLGVVADAVLVLACAWQWYMDTASIGLLWLAAIMIFTREGQRNLREIAQSADGD